MPCGQDALALDESMDCDEWREQWSLASGGSSSAGGGGGSSVTTSQHPLAWLLCGLFGLRGQLAVGKATYEEREEARFVATGALQVLFACPSRFSRLSEEIRSNLECLGNPTCVLDPTL
eukprot:SAG11_NODE_3021_length_2757_cov_2.291196_5_plen_119_part_00